MRALLPHGCWIAGLRCRELEVRVPGPEDDAFVIETAGMPPVLRANLLLGRCVTPPGTAADARSLVRSLVAGDREALLLQLRQAVFGDDLGSVLHCATRGCGSALDLNLRVGELLLAPYPQLEESFTRAIGHGGQKWEVGFRLPTAGDQEDAASLPSAEVDDVARWILERCVDSIRCDGRELAPGDLPGSLFERVAEFMGELDPQACVELDLKCPACGSACEAQLDTGDFLLRELDQRAEGVLRDTHALALCYHWSEAEILAMSPARRQRYLDLIAEGSTTVSQE